MNFAINTTFFIKRLTNGSTLGVLAFGIMSSCQLTTIFLGLTILVVPRHRCIQSMSTKSSLVVYPNLVFILRISQEIYTNLGKNGLLEKQEKEQTFCEGCPKYVYFLPYKKVLLNYS